MDQESQSDRPEGERTNAEDPWCTVLREVSEPTLLAISDLAVEHEEGALSDSGFEEQCYSIIRSAAPNSEMRERWLSLLGVA